jgi:Protein of unknown function (DUF2924)
MNTIEVDFDVLKALMAKRSSESVTYNDVLREMLGLKAVSAGSKKQVDQVPQGAWVTKGLAFEPGTHLRAIHKGRVYEGFVISGALNVKGRDYQSPSAAAAAITGYPVNGWNFWTVDVGRPGASDWRSLSSLRKR